MSAPRRRRRAPTNITTSPQPSVIGPLLREIGFIGCDDDPISCRATFSPDGTPRSIKARYAGGWCCRLTLLRSGGYSLTQSISIRFRSKPKALQA